MDAIGRSRPIGQGPVVRRRRTLSPRSALLALSLLVALILVGCTTGATPSATGTGSPAASTSPAVSQGPGPTSSGPAPSAPTAPPSATPSPSATAPAVVSPCPIEPASLTLASDRMIDVGIVLGANVDVVRFRFGPATWQGSPAAAPSVMTAPASPPYLADPSGLPLEVTGERAASIRMAGMWLYDDAGVPTYGGPARFDEPGPGLRSAVLAGTFEGYETWLIGFDGPGCLTVEHGEDGSLEVRIAHPCGC